MPQNHPIFRPITLVIAITLVIVAVLVLATSAAPASAQIFYVKYFAVPNPGIMADCTKASPCSLQTAVNKAGDGDIVYLKGGIQRYRSTAAQVVHINKSVVIQGGWDGSSIGRFEHVDPIAYPTVLDGENTRRVILIDGDASPKLYGLEIFDGYINEGEGGGVAIMNANSGEVLIHQCWMYDNFAGWYGGGIAINKGTVTFQNGTLINNTATNGGGAIEAGYGTTVVLENSIIGYNFAAYGSAGHFDRANLTFRSNIVPFNSGSPAISVNNQSQQTLILENNIISRTKGAAVEVSASEPHSITFLHNTLVNNEGLGLSVSSNVAGMIDNNIFVRSKYDSISLGTGSTATVSSNLFWENGSDPVLGTDPIQEDPMLDGSFHLLAGSPAINAGTASTVLVDVDGQKRPLGLPDIGADEYMLRLMIPLAMP